MNHRSTLLRLAAVWAAAAFPATSDSPSPDTLFHPAARDFIYGKIEEAKQQVDAALALYPDDRKLQQLKELLERSQENQPESQPDSSDPTAGQPESTPPETDDSTESGNPSAPAQAAEPADPREEERVMSEEEAIRLLDAMKQNEQDYRRGLRPVLGPSVPVGKDW